MTATTKEFLEGWAFMFLSTFIYSFSTWVFMYGSNCTIPLSIQISFVAGIPLVCSFLISTMIFVGFEITNMPSDNSIKKDAKTEECD